MIKSKPEIEKMRVAGKLAAQALDMIGQYVKAGVSTGELNDRCHEFIVQKQHASPACLHYRGFPKSICISVNEVVCHGIPGDYRLKDGDILNIDITVEKDGYHGDTSRMFSVGELSLTAKRLISITSRALYLGIAEVRPGNDLRNIGKAIQKYTEHQGFSVVESFCGHGIGKEFHEPPNVLHYYHPQANRLILQPGMIFTIEPMINAGKKDCEVLPDGWTAITKDKSLSAQFEHTILVTNNGAEILTRI